MNFLPVTLGIARVPGSPQTASGPGAASAGLSADIRQKILERDQHTCRFCGFKSQKYQDVHAMNGNLADTRMENLVTACIFCHQCFDLEKTSAMRSGVLIWLPEISQAELHHIARAVYVARISQGSMAESAKAA